VKEVERICKEKSVNFTFKGPCFVNIFNHNNKMHRYTMVCITISSLHVAGGSCAHHVELKTVYTQKKLDKYPMLCIQF